MADGNDVICRSCRITVIIPTCVGSDSMIVYNFNHNLLFFPLTMVPIM